MVCQMVGFDDPPWMLPPALVVAVTELPPTAEPASTPLLMVEEDSDRDENTPGPNQASIDPFFTICIKVRQVFGTVIFSRRSKKQLH
jgi:hypothetical protein